MTGTGTLRLAHRGDWRVAPENTAAAFAAAMTLPACDGVEFDVQLSRDGVPVVIHDETLTRVQRRHARVDQLSARELETHAIPSLEDTLAMLPPDAWLDVELKGETHGDATAAVLRDARGAAPDRAVLSSFDPPALVAMADRLPDWTRWLNAVDLAPATLSLAVGLGCRGVSVLWPAVTPARFRAARAVGLDVAAWTVRRRATFDRLARLGVVACCVEAAALDGSDT
jgi:glycerophosphoryl diester phosphodiesterase